MRIAELFVRLTADTRGFKGNMSDAERSMDAFGKTSDRVERQTGRATLGVGRLGNQFGSLISSMAGVHPVATNVVGVLGNFAIGAVWMTGVLAGLTAITIAWRRITRDSREAATEMKGAIDRLKELQRVESLGTFGQTGADVRGGMAAAGAISRKLEREKSLLGREGATFMETELRKRNIARLTQQYNEAIAAVKAGERAVWKAVEDAKPAAAKVATTKVREAMAADIIGINLTASQLNRGLANEQAKRDALGGGIAAGAQAELAAGNKPGQLTSTLSAMVRAQSGFVEATRGLGDKMRDALGGVTEGLLRGLTTVAQAMILGGGGRGSQIGGALGGGIGGAVGGALLGGKMGSMGGPIGIAVGTVLGTLGGSLFGGLFDKKKKVANGLDMMARGLDRVNSAMRNAPSGYRAALSTYNSTTPQVTPPTPPGWPGGGGPGMPGGPIIISGDISILANSPSQFVKEIGRYVQQETSRGGATGLNVALAGG